MPTAHYGWTLPTEGQDPWYSTMDTLFNAIDTSVHSVQVGMVTHLTTVMSVYPTGILLISSGKSMGADGVWMVMSVNPFGRCVGSFALVTSGAQASFDLRITAAPPGFGPSGVGEFGAQLTGRFRLVVAGNGASSLVVPNNSAWISVFGLENITWTLPLFTSIVSLGPGNFSCELQAAVPGNTDTASILAFGNAPQHCAILLVDELRV